MIRWLRPAGIGPPAPATSLRVWCVLHKENHDHPHDTHGPPRTRPVRRPLAARSYTLGVAGPVGSGKTALVEMLCSSSGPRSTSQ